MTTTRSTTRLRRYAAEYHQSMWSNLPYRPPTADELITMDIRADGYANAHVEGSHGTEDRPCSFATARECGERYAASEYVECTDMTEPVASPRTGSHADHDHPATKAARAACRRAAATAIEA